MKAITGSFFEFEHHNRAEGKYYNQTLFSFTEEQWRQLIRDQAELGLDTLVLMASALYEKAYYSTGIYPYASHLTCKNVLEVLLDEADRLNLRIYLSAGFYGDWTRPQQNTTDPACIRLSLRAMNEMCERFGSHPCLAGWYMPDEWEINGAFDERFIAYVNTISAEAKKLNPKYKTVIGPYGTNKVVADDEFVRRLERMNLDIVAYQDEVGVKKTAPNEEAGFFEALSRAHRKAGRSELWADMEIFDFEGVVYRSALIPAPWERVKQQMEAISPFVEKIIVYCYTGMMAKPQSPARAGFPGKAEALYRAYRAFLQTL